MMELLHHPLAANTVIVNNFKQESSMDAKKLVGKNFMTNRIFT